MTKENIVSLCKLENNQSAIIVTIAAGRKTTKRLVDLGLTPNTPVKILRKTLFCGPIEILVRGSKIILGNEIATKILVKKL